MRTRSLALIVGLLVVVLTGSSQTYAATLVVTKTADTADGVCDPDCSLREAITAAMSGDTIVFSPLFNEPKTIALQLGQIMFAKSLSIIGPGRALLSISGNNAGRIFWVEGEAVVDFAHMTFKDGRVTTVPSGFSHAGSAFYVVDSTLNLLDVSVTNNYVASQPPGGVGYGAVYCERCVLNVSDSNISSNFGPVTGGIHSEEGLVKIVNTSFLNNTGLALNGNFHDVIVVSGSEFRNHSTRAVTFGNNSQVLITDTDISGNAAGVSVEGSVVVFENCTIRDNSSNISGGIGGGLFNRGTSILKRTIIENNTVTDRGGGIWNVSDVYLIDSAVIGNTASKGGGIHNASANLYVTNSTISGNRATGSAGVGGGIFNGTIFATQTTLINSTISNNHAGGRGGGIRNEEAGIVTTVNTIMAGNTSGSSEVDLSGVAVSRGNNLIGSTVGSSGWLASDILNQNPLLAPLGNNGNNTFSHALLPGSPAINAGNNALALDPQTMFPLVYDQRGSERFVGTVDIGAYEASYSSSPVNVSGRVTNSTMRGLDRTRIKLDDGQGHIIYTQTNPFGYYRSTASRPGRPI
jgi:CSLREA domain-containing protein